MATQISPLAGKPVPASLLVDVGKLVTAYYTGIPDPMQPAQRVAFGTSGHRGSSFQLSFNERHVLAITPAICRYRKKEGIGGPLFLGIELRFLSVDMVQQADSGHPGLPLGAAPMAYVLWTRFMKHHHGRQRRRTRQAAPRP